jgi:hypothetical protein
MSADVEQRLEELESLVQHQQETIEAQRERIAELEERPEPGGRADRRGADAGSDDETDVVSGEGEGESERGEAAVPVSRRGAVKAGGLLALAGVGAGAAGANPTGQVGTSSRPLSGVYTELLGGGLTGGTEVTDLTGAGLDIETNSLGVAWEDASDLTADGSLDSSVASGIQSLSGGDGIDPNSIGDGDTLSVAAGNFAGAFLSTDGSSNLTVDAGSGLENDGSDALQAALGNALGFDSSNRIAVTSDSLTIAGNSVSLGGSTGVAYTDLSDTGGSFPIANGDLANSSITVTAGNGLSGGGSTALGSATTLDVASGGVGTSELASGAVTTTEISDGTIATDDIGQNGATDGNVLVWDGAAVSWVTSGLAHADLSTITSDDHHVRPSAGAGLTDNSNTFDVGAGSYLSTTSGQVGFDAAAEWDGGSGNTASGTGATVAGGENNEGNGQSATVAGGRNNDAGAEYATIAGGGPSDLGNPDSTRNAIYDEYGTIGGGGGNQAGTDDGDPQDPSNAPYATVGGGKNNTASAEAASVGGGAGNESTDRWATVGGGIVNVSKGQYSTIAGGRQNIASGNRSTIAGGNYNRATQKNATVGGGRYNRAKAEKATIPGGSQNRALGVESFAAGAFAKAADENTFVWSDGSGATDSAGSASDRFSSSTSDGTSGVTGPRTFHVKSVFGVRFVTSGDNSQVAYISNTSAGWSNTSTRAVKTNIEPVEPESVLSGVESLEVSTWEYATEDGDGQGERHMGPMAEGFHEAFDVGDNDAAINSINADGVAFAAIQGLSAKLDGTRERLDGTRDELDAARNELDEREERIDELAAASDRKDERIDALEAENERLTETTERLRERNADLEDRLAAVEAQLGLEDTTADQTVADD